MEIQNVKYISDSTIQCPLMPNGIICNVVNINLNSLHEQCFMPHSCPIKECKIFIYTLYTNCLILKFIFIPCSEFNAYLKQIKVILSEVKKYRIFSLVTNTIYIFSLYQTEAVSTI